MTPRVDLEWLARLCAIPGVSGDEAAVRRAVWERVRPHAEEAWVDPLGTLVVARGWRSAVRPRVALAAHLDEVGLIVTGIDDSGQLRFEVVGGIDRRLLPGALVRVGPEGLPAAVAIPPVHLSAREARARAPEVGDLRLDIGAANRSEAAAAVRPGDRATFATGAGPLGRLFRGRACDDRAGVAVLAAVWEAVAALELPLAALFTVQEEIGTRGSAAAADALGADICVIAEVTTAADLPGVPEHRRVARLGAGPVLTALDARMIASRRLLADLAAAADAAGIAYQWKEAASGATDGHRFQDASAEVAVVSVPGRYLHAPQAVIDPQDLQGAARLIAAWLARLPGGGGTS